MYAPTGQAPNQPTIGPLVAPETALLIMGLTKFEAVVKLSYEQLVDPPLGLKLVDVQTTSSWVMKPDTGPPYEKIG